MTCKALYILLSQITTNVFPLVIPQSVDLPFIRYQKISTRPADTKTSVSKFDSETWQVSVFTNTYELAKNLSMQVRNTLDLYSGVVGDVDIDSIRFEDENELFETDAEIYHIALDFKIRINN